MIVKVPVDTMSIRSKSKELRVGSLISTPSPDPPPIPPTPQVIVPDVDESELARQREALRQRQATRASFRIDRQPLNTGGTDTNTGINLQ